MWWHFRKSSLSRPDSSFIGKVTLNVLWSDKPFRLYLYTCALFVNHQSVSTPLQGCELQIAVFAKLANIRTVYLIVGEAISNEWFSLLRNQRLGWEVNFCRVKHRLIAQDVVLRLSVAEWTPSEYHLIVDYTNRPDVDFIAATRRLAKERERREIILS